MTSDCALTLARCCVLLPGLALFGAACFSLYAAAELQGPPRVWLRAGLPALAAAGAVAWIALIGRQMSDAPGLPDAATLGQIVRGTVFGRALAAAALLGLALTALSLDKGRRRGLRVVLATALLVCLAFVGHAAAAPGLSGAVRVAVMAAHLLAAGLWLGGLPPLARALRREGPAVARLLRRFGAIGLGCVCVILASGLASGLFMLGTTGGRVGPRYLTVLSTKLVLVAGLLALAAVNRFRLTPRAGRDDGLAIAALRRSVWLEQALGAGVIAAVALLGQLDPSM